MKNFAARELAMLAAIDAAMHKETSPEVVVLMRGLKEGHQDAHSRVCALARLEVRPPARGWPIASMVMQLEGWLARTYGVDLTIDMLRRLEHKFQVAYLEACDESTGLRREVMQRLADRAAQRWHVLEEFTGRACMRCLLDRPGPAPLSRDYPHIYICGACHEEVRAAFPPDLELDRWPKHMRDAHIIERALGAAEQQRARDEVHTALAGQLPIPATKPAPRPAVLDEPAGPVSRVPTALTMTATDSEHEAAYTAWLFDYRSVRAWW